MKRAIIVIYALLILFSLSACGNSKQDENTLTPPQNIEVSDSLEKIPIMDSSIQPETEEIQNQSVQSEKPTQSNTSPQIDGEKEETKYMLNIQIGEHLLTATLVHNSSTEALIEMLSDGAITINMRDYANMEKVGELPTSLPRNDEQISTEAGDLILYQGNAFVIYYDINSWNFTRLGRINNITPQELKEILGDGNITVELSLSTKL